MFFSDISISVSTLLADIDEFKDSLVNGNSRASATRREIFSQALSDKYKLLCNMWRVAVFELAAASFCKPTKAFLSGVLP